MMCRAFGTFLQLCPVLLSSSVLPGGYAPSSMVVATAAIEKVGVQKTRSFFNVIVLVANDAINVAGDNALGGAGSGQPAFCGKTGNIGGGRWFRKRSSGLGHGGVG
jgi:hypothetical protein